MHLAKLSPTSSGTPTIFFLTGKFKYSAADYTTLKPNKYDKCWDVVRNSITRQFLFFYSLVFFFCFYIRILSEGCFLVLKLIYYTCLEKI